MAVSRAWVLSRPVAVGAQLHPKAPDIDAVARGVAFVGRVGRLQEVGDVIEHFVVGERQVFFQYLALFVALGEIY